METGRESRALAAALASVALWSTVATAFKLGLAEMAPVQLLLIACVVSLIFFVAVRLVLWRGIAPMSNSVRWRVAALGLVNPLAYYLILFEAYDRLPAQVAQPLNYTWAIVVALLAWPILGQRLRGRGWVGIAIAYGGVTLLLTRGEFGGLAFDLTGVLLALASTVLWASYWLATVRVSAHPVQGMLAGFATATPLVAIVCAATAGLPHLTATNLAFGLWVGLVEMGITFLLWQRALSLTRHVGAISQLIFLSPFLSLVLIAVVLGEDLHYSAPAALALIVLGLVVTGRPGSNDPPKPA